MDQGIEGEGKTVADAVEAALKLSTLKRHQVEVTVLQEPSSGFLGMGAKPARVRIREKRWQAEGAAARQDAVARPPRPRPAHAEKPALHRPPEPAASGPQTPDEAVQLIKEILALMDVQGAAVSGQWDSVQERVKAVIETQDAERVIGRDGHTIASLQFLVNLILARRSRNPTAVTVDVQGYLESKEKAVLEEAQRAIDLVKRTGKPFRLPPMEPASRRLIHRSLADHPDIVTSSEGEGSWRKIVIKPRS